MILAKLSNPLVVIAVLAIIIGIIAFILKVLIKREKNNFNKKITIFLIVIFLLLC